MKPDHRVRGAVALLRESFRNDGAEGESVHVVCDFIDDNFPADALGEMDFSPAVEAKLREIGAEFTHAKNALYSERNKCVALLAGLAFDLGFPVGCLLDEEAKDGFNILVVIDLPSGQVSWHAHESEYEWFAWLPEYEGQWDGHTTEEKYARVLAHAVHSAEAGPNSLGHRERCKFVQTGREGTCNCGYVPTHYVKARLR